eukprot:CAMPEP_0117689112 /NCGR_PEP_ID=MMETSP0804-20121206/24275_1 /TAXON_ID=1074897 /ORGANISM="Tetraselmis astigmatica, Strain CCMP880" /LENGTH=191 /DNA_ID=CAMNT_0005501781 /DNA_START=87 /DNA_END=662 /DNA_ORIENTATION=+
MSLYNELMRSCLRHPTAGVESPFGSVRAYGNDRSSAPGVRNTQSGRSSVAILQEPLLGEPGSPRSPRSSRGVNMPGSMPRSPNAGRPPLHPNSFGSNSHFARSLTYNPDVLSPHSLGSFNGNDSMRSPSGPGPQRQQLPGPQPIVQHFSTTAPAAGAISRGDSETAAEGRRGTPTSSLTVSTPPATGPDAA